MEPSVPFALLAAVQLLAVAAFLALSATVLASTVRRGAARLGALGAVAVASSEAITGATLGNPSSQGLALLRAAGFGLLALAAVSWTRRGADLGEQVASVAPLSAAFPVSGTCAALAGIAAALVAREPGSDRGLLAPGLALSGGALLLAPWAVDSPAAATGLLVVRGLGAIAVLGYAVRRTRTSVLSKVVAAIVAGVLLTAVGAASVVGTVVADSFNDQQGEQIRTVALAELRDLKDLRQESVNLSRLIAAGGRSASDFAKVIQGLRTERGFALMVDRHGSVTDLGGASGLDPAARLDVARLGPVQAALAKPRQVIPALALVRGRTPQLVALGVVGETPDSAHPTAPPAFVVVYGIVVDDDRLRAVQSRSAFDSTVLSLPDGEVVATSLDSTGAQAVAGRVRQAGTLDSLTDETEVRSEIAAGQAPATGSVLVLSGTTPVAVLVVSQPAEVVLRTQRLVLAGLFVALIVIGTLVGLLATVLGRRVVDPVRRLTEAAESVRRGDLSASASVQSADEIGRLSRTFDEMTASLAGATEQLRETAEVEATTRARLQTVLDAMSDGLVVTDEADRVTGVNPAAARLVGPDDDVLGRPLTEVLAPAGGGDPLLGKGSRAEGVGLLRRPDGSGVPVAVSRAPLPSRRGSVVVLRDMTREREVEKMKTEFLSNVSHELRTPLTPIKGFAELIATKDLGPDRTRAFAGTILQSTARLARIVDLLVDVAALDAGRVVPVPVEVSVRTLLDSRVAAWSARVPDRARDLKRRVASGLPQVLVDPDWLAKALDEYVDNALKFSAPGSAVTLSAEAGPAGFVRLVVRDRGEGIEPAARAQLFTDFAQIDGSATRSQDGLGLGLAFVGRVAGVIGVRYEIDSTPGKGTIAVLDVPAVPGRGKRSSAV